MTAAVLLRAPDECRDTLAAHLAGAGVSVLAASDSPDVPVVGVWLGQPPPAATDTWLRDSRPHLVVSLSATHLRVGPFVDPGLTACLHCLSAGSTPPQPGGPGVPPAGMMMVCAGWVAHDVRRWHEGREPVTWSTTVLLDARLEVVRQRWPRHPHCGCGWGLTA